MRSINLFSVARALVLSLAAFTSTAQGGELPGKLPAKFELPGLGGGSLTADSLKSKVVVIQFWASYCTGCKAVMKEINKLHKTNSNFTYVPISVDESMAAAKGYFAKAPKELKEVRKMAYLDKDGNLAEKMGVMAVPTFLVIDTDGKIVKRYIGHPDTDGMAEMLKTIVGTIAH